MGLFKSIFKSYSEREVKRIEPIANNVLGFDDEMG